MLAAPILTAKKFTAAKDVGALTITYFCCQFLNCTGWTVYGLLIQSAPVSLCNVWGCCVSAYCCVKFLITVKAMEISGRSPISTNYVKSFRIAIYAAVASLLIVLLITLVASTNEPAATVICGAFSAAFSVVMLASPVELVRHIVTTKSADVLSPQTIGMALINAIIWFLFGLVRADPFITVPNLLGGSFTFFLGCLLLRYGSGVKSGIHHAPSSECVVVATEGHQAEDYQHDVMDEPPTKNSFGNSFRKTSKQPSEDTPQPKYE